MKKIIKIVLLICILCTQAYALPTKKDTLQSKCIVVLQPQKEKPMDTGYTIRDLDGLQHKIYRGPKGGYYYTKQRKKIYLTKKQKALIGK